MTWTHNGGPLSNDATVETRLNKTVLTIPKVKQSHSGHYTCFIENDAGSAQCTCDVIVKSECLFVFIGVFLFILFSLFNLVLLNKIASLVCISDSLSFLHSCNCYSSVCVYCGVLVYFVFIVES